MAEGMTGESFDRGRITLHHGDSRDVLKTIPDNSVDSVCTDPPYALVSIVRRFGGENAAPAKNDVYARASRGFMGKTWDTGETAFAVEFWAEVLRVLKPGGHVVAASGTRTYHRLACAVEDAGFEIRDMVSWLYGSGFPKSHAPLHGIRALPRTLNEEEWRHFYRIARIMTGSALKPACEPWVFARKPLDGTIALNVLAHGTGALNINGCRIGQDVVGRWPANVIHDGSDEVVSAFPAAPGQIMAVGPKHGKKLSKGIYGDMGPARKLFRGRTRVQRLASSTAPRPTQTTGWAPSTRPSSLST